MYNRKKPAYTLHRSTGHARVRIDGKDHYLGEYGSVAIRAKYDDLVSRWLLRNGELRKYKLTVDELALL